MPVGRLSHPKAVKADAGAYSALHASEGAKGQFFATLLSWMVEKPMLKPYWKDTPKRSQEDFLWIYRKARLEPPASLNM